MATLSSGQFNLLDLAQLPSNAEAAEVINLLSQYNPILEDAPALECNMGTHHKTTVLTGLPTPTWGKLYQGVAATKGKRQAVTDTTGFLEAASEVDERLLDPIEKAEDKASVMIQEAAAHLEAMSQEAATALFYHDTDTDPEKPMGFAPRFNSLSAENGGQIISAAGAGADNTSIWMITWDRMANHLIYPKTGTLGIQRIPRGKVVASDAAGNSYFVEREDFKWHMGLSVRDWRYVARVANIDVSDLTVDASAGANLLESMTNMYYKHHGRRMMKGRTFIYVNTTIMKFLDFQARNVPKNLELQYSQTGPNAQEVLYYRGIPIRECDALVESEAVVS